MQHANFTAWAKACNLLDDKWYVYQYIRRLKTYHRQGQKCDEKTKKETKWQDSPRQDLIPDHGPQHGAVRCSTYWASILNSCIRCSTHCKDQALTHWCYSIEEKESLLQWFVIDSISKKNFVLLFAVPFKKYLFFVYKCITSILLLEQKHTIYSMINDMCISISGHQRPIISKEKNMIKKIKKETKKQNSLRQNLTLISDTLVNIIGSVLNSCFKFPLHCKRTSLTKKRNKNDKIPRSRIWSRTTDRNMVRSDALPTELRGTCQRLRLNIKLMF